MLNVIELQKEKLYENAVINIEEMAQRKTILTSYPFKVYIEPTQRCDLDCIMCNKSRHKSMLDMPLDLFYKIEKELFSYASEVDFFIGGESTLARDFNKMIRVSEKYHFLPKIFTNAVNTPDETIRLMVELGFFVNISLDAVQKNLYEKIRKGANFDNFIKTIDKYLFYQKKINNPRFHIRFACTCAPYNIDDVVNIVKFAKVRGVDDIFFGNCDRNVFDREFHLSRVSQKAYEMLMATKAFADSNKIRFSCQKKIGNIEVKDNHNWHNFKLPIDQYALPYLEQYNPVNGTCPYPWNQILIRSDASVMACCQGYVKMGNYINDGFRQIWNNKKYQKLRQRKSYYHCGLTMGRWYCNVTRTSVWGS